MAKWFSVRLQTKWFWVWVQLQSLKTSDFAPALSKEFLDIQITIECGFTLKLVRDMTRTYSQMNRTDNYPEHSSIIWPVWPSGWVFVYKLSGSGCKTSCSHLNSFFINHYYMQINEKDYFIWHNSFFKVNHDHFFLLLIPYFKALLNRKKITSFSTNTFISS